MYDSIIYSVPHVLKKSIALFQGSQESLIFATGKISVTFMISIEICRITSEEEQKS
jgi:hypothetical protein